MNTEYLLAAILDCGTADLEKMAAEGASTLAEDAFGVDSIDYHIANYVHQNYIFNDILYAVYDRIRGEVCTEAMNILETLDEPDSLIDEAKNELSRELIVSPYCDYLASSIGGILGDIVDYDENVVYNANKLLENVIDEIKECEV